MTTRRVLATTALGFVAVLLSACGASETQRDEDGAVTERNDDASVFEIQVGDCYNLPEEDATEVETMAAVPCGDPHEAEAYHEIEIEGDEFPGAGVVDEQAATECQAEFDTFIGMPYDQSTLDFYYLSPTQDTWEQLDDRLISCLVYDPANAEITGSLEGAAR